MAQKAKQSTEDAQKDEEKSLDKIAQIIDELVNGENSETPSGPYLSTYIGKSLNIAINGENYGELSCSVDDDNIATAQISTNDGKDILVINPISMGSTSVVVEGDGLKEEYIIYSYTSKDEYDYLKSIFEGKKISILGDSISTLKEYIPENYASYYSLNGTNAIDSVDSTYWGSIIKRFNMTLGINGSYSGSMISNSIEEDSIPFGPNIAMASNTRIQALDDNGVPDVIIFYGGTNDYFQGVTLGKFDYTANYANVLDLNAYKWDSLVEAYSTALLRLKHYYPNSKIITLLPHNANSNWNEGMKAVCNYLNVEYINLYPANIRDTHPTSTQFNVLTNYILHTLYTKHIDIINTDNDDRNINLPSGYTRLNYIESSGEQYIDTGITPTNSTRWELRAQFENLSTAQYNGILDSTSNNGFQVGMTSSGNFTLHLGTSTTSESSYYDNYIHTFILDGKNLRSGVDDTYYSGKSINDSGYSATIYIGARHRVNSNGAESVQSYITEKIYSSKIYENDQLKQYLIPCTNENGKVGMYDTIKGTFYSSLTAKEFIAGN